jgi:hypothetical protein
VTPYKKYRVSGKFWAQNALTFSIRYAISSRQSNGEESLHDFKVTKTYDFNPM